jgi:ABC-type dipeptide/oligopeptide/nickel transport system permease component
VSAGRFLLQRVTGALIVLIAVSTLVFGLLELAPGDPARSVLEARSGGRVPAEAAVAVQREAMGLSDPLPLRYLAWVTDALCGDLGTSHLTGRPVSGLLGPALVWTLVLALAATVLSVVGAIAVGLLAALTDSSMLRRGIEGTMFALGGMPGFVTALLLLYLFAGQLQLLPTGGVGRPGEALTAGSLVAHLALPAAALAFGHHFGVYVRLVQTGVERIRQAPHVESARARGLHPSTLTRRHLLRPGLVPFVTRLGVGTGGLLAGAYVIEVIFAWPGLGRLAIESARAEDYPVLTATVLVTAVCVLAANLAGELAASRLDPRVRLPPLQGEAVHGY